MKALFAAGSGRPKAVGRWLLTFSTGTLLFVGLVLLVDWLLGGFGAGTLSVRGWIAVTLGSLFTVALGVGLMALVFYSDRSGRDDT